MVCLAAAWRLPLAGVTNALTAESALQYTTRALPKSIENSHSAKQSESRQGGSILTKRSRWSKIILYNSGRPSNDAFAFGRATESIRGYRLAVRTAGSQLVNRGSIPRIPIEIVMCGAVRKLEFSDRVCHSIQLVFVASPAPAFFAIRHPCSRPNADTPSFSCFVHRRTR